MKGLIDFFKNIWFVDKTKKYENHPEAIVISCFFNPLNSPYRLKVFFEFYNSIKHLNHKIVECVIGDTKQQLSSGEHVEVLCTESLLWHKEALLNYIICKLPKKYKYVFWIDADVLFTNPNWLAEGVEQLKKCNILQPFEYCVHLEKDEMKPSFDVEKLKSTASDPQFRHKTLWRSFCANFVTTSLSSSENYDEHGHVGLAWGARRDLLEKILLYDRALIGGADHIMAHAAAGQIPHKCITKSFTENIDEINEWSQKFFSIIQGKIGYVTGDLYHMWHGDINKRRYLKRVQDFTAQNVQITKKDGNGLYLNSGDDTYVKKHFKNREVPPRSGSVNDGFLTSAAIAYFTDSALLGTLAGGNIAGALIGDALNNSDEEKELNAEQDVSNNQEVPVDDVDNSNNEDDSDGSDDENFS